MQSVPGYGTNSVQDAADAGYSFGGLVRMDQIPGGRPYGTATLAAPDRSRRPSDNELEVARFHGRYARQAATWCGRETHRLTEAGRAA